MIISMLLGVWLEVFGSGFLALGSFFLVCDPNGWILLQYVQGSGISVDDAWLLVLGPGRLQLSRFLGRFGFMTLIWVSIDTFKLPISEARICFSLLFSWHMSLRAKVAYYFNFKTRLILTISTPSGINLVWYSIDLGAYRVKIWEGTDPWCKEHGTEYNFGKKAMGHKYVEE